MPADENGASGRRGHPVRPRGHPGRRHDDRALDRSPGGRRAAAEAEPLAPSLLIVLVVVLVLLAAAAGLYWALYL